MVSVLDAPQGCHEAIHPAVLAEPCLSESVLKGGTWWDWERS